ncbi:MAG: chemotaxis protein CheA [Armatimonadetes bacterium]|nr:chemotaxis protein CheA [Armatimonadota bacterium]
MSAELDMSQYIDLFLQEAEEQIEVLEQETLGLEQDPTDDRLQVIFRAAHTLKGSSRAMGFSQFAEVTHEMENILDRLRNHTLSVTTEIADSILACIDTLAQMVDSIGQGNGDQIECAALVARLRKVQEGGNEAPRPAAGPTQVIELPSASGWPFRTHVSSDLFSALEEAAAAGPVFHAKVRLASDCVMKFVRAFMAVSIAQEAGELLACHPDQEKLEEEEFDTDFELIFTSSLTQEEIDTKFKGISEVENYWLGGWQTPTDEAPEVVAEPVGSVAQQEVPESAVVTPAAPSAPSTPATQGAARKGDTGQTVRVDVARLDNLMNLVGELVIDRTRISQIGNDLSNRFQDPNIDALAETVSHIARITSDLQDQIMKARMMPIETVFNRFPRVVRDLAQKLGKDVKLELLGGETELDRSVIEVIGDPLLHILRNSIDHGLEDPADRVKAGKPAQGTVVVSARHQENHIVIEIVDDGKGIDVERVKRKAVETGFMTQDAVDRLSDKEALQLIFQSGLSTAKEVSEVSGRGVGMDIVRSNIQKLGGLIDLETTVGVGTKTSLRLPLTLAIIRGLLVEVQGEIFVVPLGSVIETLLISPKDIQRINQREVIVIRGMTTPLVRLETVYGSNLNPEANTTDDMYGVIVGLAEQRLGLIVDRLIGEQEVVIKSLSRFCGDVPGVSGATILGDGNVALIMDVNGIVATNERG